MIEVVNVGLWTAGAAVTRAVAGWLENAVEDGEIDWPEIKELGKTLFRMSAPALSLWAGFDVAPFEAAYMAIIFDVVVLKLHKLLSK